MRRCVPLIGARAREGTTGQGGSGHRRRCLRHASSIGADGPVGFRWSFGDRSPIRIRDDQRRRCSAGTCAAGRFPVVGRRPARSRTSYRIWGTGCSLLLEEAAGRWVAWLWLAGRPNQPRRISAGVWTKSATASAATATIAPRSPVASAK